MQRTAPSPLGATMSAPSLRGAVADDFGVDLRAARLRVFELLHHHHAAAAGDDEAVAVGVVGARGLLRRVVELRGQRAHRVEQHGLRPVQFFAATGEHDVLLAVAGSVPSAAPMQCAEVAQAEEIE